MDPNVAGSLVTSIPGGAEEDQMPDRHVQSETHSQSPVLEDDLLLDIDRPPSPVESDGPAHLRSFSVDEFLDGGQPPWAEGGAHLRRDDFFEGLELEGQSSATKAVADDKLAETTLIERKREKRKQIAAPSGQRKALYINELKTKAAEQSATLERDPEALISENKELKLKLQDMEEQIQLIEDSVLVLSIEVRLLKIEVKECRELNRPR